MRDLAQFAKGVVNLVLGVVVALLGLRVVLRLFGANASNDFVNWVYETSGEILAPFRGIFQSANLDGFVVDFTALFAIMVYTIIAMLAFYAIDALEPAPTTKKRK